MFNPSLSVRVRVSREWLHFEETFFLETFLSIIFGQHQGHFTNVAQYSCLKTEMTLIIKTLSIQHEFVKALLTTELLNTVLPSDAGGTVGA